MCNTPIRVSDGDFPPVHGKTKPLHHEDFLWTVYIYIYMYRSLGKNETLECHVTVHNNNKYSLPIFVVFVSSHLKPMGLNVSSILPVVTKDLPISPRFTLYEVISRCKFSTRLQLVNQWLHFTNSRSHGFRYVRSHTFFLQGSNSWLPH